MGGVQSRASIQWFKYALIYIFMLGSFKLFVKYLLNGAQPAEILVFQYSGSLIAANIGSKITKQKPYANIDFTKKGIIHGIIGGFGVILIYQAIKLSTITQTTLLKTPLIHLTSTITGLFMFKEINQMTIKKWLGIGVSILIMILVLYAKI